MNPKKILISIVFMMLSWSFSFAQDKKPEKTAYKHFSEHIDMASDLFKAMKMLDSIVSSFFDHQKAQRLNSELVYFKIDLQQYLRIRYSIMILLENHNYDPSYFFSMKDGTVGIKGGLQRDIHSLQSQLQKLTERSVRIGNYLDDFPDFGEDLSQEFYITEQEQATSYLAEVDELIGQTYFKNGKVVSTRIDRAQLRKVGRDIYNELRKTVTVITDIQKKLEKV